MTIRLPQIGTITQGTIFCCASAERYPGARVFGVAITARCDVANDKFPVLNYIPAVLLTDWFHCDGWEILHSKTSKAAEGSFLSALKQQDISETILYSKSHREIYESFFVGENALGSARKSAERVRGIVEEIEILANLQITSLEQRNYLLDKYQKYSRQIIQDLIEHKLSGHYYLPAIPGEDNVPLVALMRESSFIPRDIAEAIARGTDQARAPQVSRGGAGLDFSIDEFAMPLGQLMSPNIEHLMQTYSQMFGRIGIEDTPAEALKAIFSIELRKATQ
ncbi:hypothetical protein [Falsigemmobacter faecalis]|uniref:Uncharacterized protein n=1 Tax=Falsigemmobacter faecalis TaxID=2488730 RepID=A0A3P3D913_9RHOB|nr:hypothetical protein [Falsigemmobacter faecalis]RRH68868.1 hypothetical protein EG244_19065 [Falsigemmobacter faecalis]